MTTRRRIFQDWFIEALPQIPATFQRTTGYTEKIPGRHTRAKCSRICSCERMDFNWQSQMASVAMFGQSPLGFETSNRSRLHGTRWDLNWSCPYFNCVMERLFRRDWHFTQEASVQESQRQEAGKHSFVSIPDGQFQWQTKKFYQSFHAINNSIIRNLETGKNDILTSTEASPRLSTTSIQDGRKWNFDCGSLRDSIYIYILLRLRVNFPHKISITAWRR